MCLNRCMQYMICDTIVWIVLFQWSVHFVTQNRCKNLLLFSSGCVLTTYNISAKPFCKGFCWLFACSDNKRSHGLAMKWLLKDKMIFEAKMTLELICRYRQHAPPPLSRSLFRLFHTAGSRCLRHHWEAGIFSFKTWKETKSKGLKKHTKQ